MWRDDLDVEVTLLGRTLTACTGETGSDILRMECADGDVFEFYHEQDCCESVRIEEIHGDLADLVGSPLLVAEVSTNSDNPPEYADSFTWTFYRFATIKGSVQVRWLGESNGYYSESVNFSQVGGSGKDDDA